MAEVRTEFHNQNDLNPNKIIEINQNTNKSIDHELKLTFKLSPSGGVVDVDLVFRIRDESPFKFIDLIDVGNQLKGAISADRKSLKFTLSNVSHNQQLARPFRVEHLNGTPVFMIMDVDSVDQADPLNHSINQGTFNVTYS